MDRLLKLKTEARKINDSATGGEFEARRPEGTEGAHTAETTVRLTPDVNEPATLSNDEGETQRKTGKGKKKGTKGKQPAVRQIASIYHQQTVTDEFEDGEIEAEEQERDNSHRNIEQQQFDNYASSSNIKTVLNTKFGRWVPNFPSYDGSMPSGSIQRPLQYCHIVPWYERTMVDTNRDLLALYFANSFKLLHAYLSRQSGIWTPSFRPFPGSSPSTSSMPPSMRQENIPVHHMCNVSRTDEDKDVISQAAEGLDGCMHDDAITTDHPQSTGMIMKLKSVANSLIALPRMLKSFVTSAPSSLPYTEL